MSSTPFEEALSAIQKSQGYDVTIICTTDDHQAAYWMSKLKKSDDASGIFPMVLAVSEDWNNSSGAGNGLGTLYAMQKAAALCQSLHQQDLMSLLASNQISVALYHTAGKGTRLAPLPASENNNKPGVQLAVPNQTTVLQAVIQQTAMYAASRKGRLSVYWGDQVFLPSQPFDYTPTHHADIMCTLLGDKPPTAEEWKEQGLDKYGVIAVLQTGEAAQVEKVSHEVATQMLKGLGGDIQQVGPSLGSFSVSATLLQALLEEFKTELEQKTDKLDTDPHFWMPLTLQVKDYVQLMQQKGVDAKVSEEHHARMAALKAKLDLSSLGLFGAVNVGKDACWWDYGQVKLYSQNSLLVLESTEQAKLLRRFLGITDNVMASSGVSAGDACVFDSKIADTAELGKAVLSNVHAKSVQAADGAILVNCASKQKIVAGKNAIGYNLISDEDIVLGDGQICVQVTQEDGSSMLLKSRTDVDGGKAWKQVLPENELSFEQVHLNNKQANIVEIEKKRQGHFQAVKDSL